MSYNVLSGTLSLYTTADHCAVKNYVCHKQLRKWSIAIMSCPQYVTDYCRVP